MSGCEAREPFLDGRLSAADAATFEAHVQGCAACQGAVGSWQQFSTGLKTARQGLALPPTPNEVARLLVRADAGPRASWQRALVPASVVVVLGVISLLVLTPKPAVDVTETPWVAGVLSSDGATTVGALTETSATGRARLSVGDDTVGLGAGSRLEVAESTSRHTRLVLSRGSVAARVDPARGARNFDVETTLGRVHVVGTEFRVTLRDDELLVEVKHGTVEVLRGASSRKVTLGQTLSMNATGVETMGARDPALDFDELLEQPVVAAAVVVPEPPVAPAVPVKKVRPVPAPQPSALAEWRTRAARGECGLVMVEVKKFLALAPDDVPARLTLADCQRRSGDKPGAVDSYLRASSNRGPDATRAVLMAGSLLQDELAQPAKALKLFDQYLARGAESRDLEASTHVRRARAFQALGQVKQRDATLDLVMKKFADTPAAVDALRLKEAP
jgi:ferric-dicitrate binding protein FerR (iron transport regulator)